MDPIVEPWSVGEGRRWERWTVDEMLDGRVRLLVCEARDAAHSLAAGPVRGGPAPPEGREGEDAPAIAMAVELAPTEATWTDEVAIVVDEAELASFLRHRSARGGLPGGRPIREGDVFWVFVPADTAVGLASPPSAVAGNEAIRAYAESAPVVLDVTAAARQAVKHIVHRAGRTTGPGEPGRG